MRSIAYLRIFSDAEDCSRFETLNVPLASNDYAPPALPLNTATPAPARRMVFLELPAGWFGDWHPTPVRQWLIFMTGQCEFETGDGQRHLSQAGDAVLLDDTTGRGHRTRVIGDTAVRIAAVHLD
jgi:hypothetical protein